MQGKTITPILIFLILIPFYFLASHDLMAANKSSGTQQITSSQPINNITQIVNKIIGGQWILTKNVTITNSSYTKYQYWLEENKSSSEIFGKQIYVCIIYFSNESLAKEQFNVTYQKYVKPIPLDWSGLNYKNINGTVFYLAPYGDPVNYYGVYAITQNSNYIITINFFRFHLLCKGTVSISPNEIAELINAIESAI